MEDEDHDGRCYADTEPDQEWDIRANPFRPPRPPAVLLRGFTESQIDGVQRGAQTRHDDACRVDGMHDVK